MTIFEMKMWLHVTHFHMCVVVMVCKYTPMGQLFKKNIFKDIVEMLSWGFLSNWSWMGRSHCDNSFHCKICIHLHGIVSWNYWVLAQYHGVPKQFERPAVCLFIDRNMCLWCIFGLWLRITLSVLVVFDHPSSFSTLYARYSICT